MIVINVLENANVRVVVIRVFGSVFYILLRRNLFFFVSNDYSVIVKV